MQKRPHRACPGGAWVSAQECGLLHRSSPPGLPRWNGGLRSNIRGASLPAGAEAIAPPRQARWGQRRGSLPLLVHKPLLHRCKPGGDDRRKAHIPCAETHALPGRARWGAVRDLGSAPSSIRTEDVASGGPSTGGWETCEPAPRVTDEAKEPASAGQSGRFRTAPPVRQHP